MSLFFVNLSMSIYALSVKNAGRKKERTSFTRGMGGCSLGCIIIATFQPTLGPLGHILARSKSFFSRASPGGEPFSEKLRTFCRFSLSLLSALRGGTF